ncbi:hypothetical protein BH10BAC3_BH10BAC3_41810 [soil metagenome]
MLFQARLIKSIPLFVLLSTQVHVLAQGTRLLRQPAISVTQVAFEYGADIWVANKNGGDAHRIKSTSAVESDPHFSPDGRLIAFSSNRSGNYQVYIVSNEGGIPTRLTWYPAGSYPRGFTPDGKKSSMLLPVKVRQLNLKDYGLFQSKEALLPCCQRHGVTMEFIHPMGKK